MQANMLTEVVADFISKDMKPVSDVDGQDFFKSDAYCGIKIHSAM